MVRKKGNRKGNGNNQKFSPEEREENIRKVEHLMLRGWTQYMIAKEIGVSQPQISAYVRTLEKRALSKKELDKKFKAAFTEAQYDEVMRLAYDYLEKSGEPQIKKIVETFQKDGLDENGEPEPQKVIKRIRQSMTRVPSNDYLQTILKCLEAKVRLLGLEAPKEWKGTVVFPFEELANELPDEELPDLVEGKLKALEALELEGDLPALEEKEKSED